MLNLSIRRAAGLGLILGATLVNVPFAILGATFDYPDVLRADTGVVLTRFAAGGAALVWTWLAFAWLGLPMLLAIVALPRAFDSEGAPLVRVATSVGITAMVVQMVGLLRWVFVVPGLARAYVDASTDEATKTAVQVAFEVVHRYGGVALGEHLGMAFTCLWMALTSVGLTRASRIPKWLGTFGVFAAAIYSLVHLELISTALPGLPHWEPAGLVGSLLWLAWTITLGVFLLRRPREPTASTNGELRPDHPAHRRDELTRGAP